MPMRVDGPADLPALRLHLLDQWKPGRTFSRVVEGGGWVLSGTPTQVSAPGVYRSIANREVETMRTASLWWVSAEMGELLTAAASTIPDDLVVADLPVPFQQGLVVFERPWTGLDSVGDAETTVGAVSWAATNTKEYGRCMSFTSYGRVDFDAGLSKDQMRNTAVVAAASNHPDRHDFIDSEGRPSATLHGIEYPPLGRSDWPIEHAIGELSYPEATPQAMASMIEDRRVMAALWLLVTQTRTAATAHRHLSRAERRRNQRESVPDWRPVNVLTLRRLAAPAGETGARVVNWSCRWHVNGHWRQTWVGEGRKRRELRWVSGHIKGPADKPLVVRQTVRAWTR